MVEEKEKDASVTERHPSHFLESDCNLLQEGKRLSVNSWVKCEVV